MSRPPARFPDLLPALRRHMASVRFSPRGRRPWRHLEIVLLLLVGLRQGLGQIGPVLTGNWLASLGGAVAGCLVLWLLGPLLSLGGWRPFEGDAPRLGGVLGIMMAWGLLNQLRQARERQANRRLVDALAAAADAGELPPDTLPRARAMAERAERLQLPPPPDKPDPLLAAASGPGEAEVRQLRRRLNEALSAYGRRRGERSLRRLPWYLVIGVPGAGKTTALANSGLSFPLSDILGHYPVQGTAGTRTCDWWFTEEAVLVDTAGRYTSQDSYQAADSAAWLGLLDLLKQHRPAQPINGVVVAVSLEDLATQSVLERHVMAETLNQRLAEIDGHLGIRLPLYLMLTKTDRIAGFTETFAHLSPEERRQVWGMTFDHTEPRGNPAGVAPTPWSAAFSGHFERLLAKLEHKVLDGLDREADPVRRSLIAGFPHQFASLRVMLTEFVALAARPDAHGLRFTLRGVYFTSAKREGVPFDRLAPEIATTFGLESPLPRPQPGATQPLFVNRLFRDVVFAEAHLARGAPAGQATQVRRWVLRAALTITLGLAVLWGRAGLISHGQLNGYEDELTAAAALLPGTLGGAQADRVADSDFAAVLPALSALRTIPAERRPTAAAEGGPSSVGLDQGERLVRAADSLYQRGLRRLLLPRLLVRLEEVIITPTDGPDTAPLARLYEALRVYLMLDGEAAADRDAITSWFTVDWIGSQPGPEHEPARRQLAGHLSALLDAGPPALPGSVLVEDEARRRLSAYPLAERGLALVRLLPEVIALPGWRLLDQTGPAAGLVMARNSGRSLTEPVPGFFTVDAARQTVLPAIGRVAADLAREGWVLGLPIDPVSVATRTRRFRQAITARYFEEYARHWQEFLTDLTITPTGGTAQLLTVMAAASGPATPLPSLIGAVVRETKVAPPAKPTESPKAGPPGKTSAASLGLPGGTVVTAIQAPNGDDDPASWWPAAAEIGARFQALQVLALPGSPRNPAPLGTALAAVADLHKALSHWTTLPAGKPGRDGATEVRRTADRVKTLAAALPVPVNGWFAAMAEAAIRATLLGPGGVP